MNAALRRRARALPSMLMIAFVAAAFVGAALAGAVRAGAPAAEPGDATPAPGAAPAALGVHGMLLFGGRDSLFASHLPMFHAPHDMQVVLRIALDDAALERRIGDALAREPAVWTLVPERFDLRRLAPGAAAPLRSFRAGIVQGHFERGGVARHRDVVVRVIAVPVFRDLDPAPRPAPTLDYLRIAAGPRAREQFLLLRIAARPGADHVLALRRGRRPIPDTLTLAADAADGLTASGDALDRALRMHDASVRVEIHRETGDLR
jgi:hypothetical protein